MLKERYIRELIYGLPYPIVAFFIRLRTDECLDPGLLRLKYILSTAESVCRFLGIVLMCECREYLENRNLQPPKSLADDFQRQFSRPTWGTWLRFSQKSLQWLNSCNIQLTMPEITDFFFTQIPAESKAVSALNELLEIRNGLSHEKIQAMTKNDYCDLCERTFPFLEQVLESLEFLLNYELAFVSQIEVRKPRKFKPSFLHRLSKLTGESDLFQGDRKSFDNSMDSESILLINEANDRSLNLDPLLVYEAKAGKSPDIFFYNGIEKQEGAAYSACKHGGRFFAKNSERAQLIIKEINNFKALFTL